MNKLINRGVFDEYDKDRSLIKINAYSLVIQYNMDGVVREVNARVQGRGVKLLGRWKISGK